MYRNECSDLTCLERIELGEKALMGRDEDTCKLELKSGNKVNV